MNTTTGRFLRTVLGLSCVLLASGGCKTYLEQETPMSTPATPVAPAAPIEGSRPLAPAGVTEAAAPASAASPYIGRPLAGSAQPLAEDVYAGSVERFRKAYVNADTPRIAVYFNRVLSDEVREWITPSRQVVAGTGQKISAGEGPTIITSRGTVVQGGDRATAEGTADTPRDVTSYTQQHVEEATRPNPEEVWMWQFEDNFLQPFLKAGAKIVDRATTLRLVAAASDKQQDPSSVIAVKQVEMNALVEYADILVEILVTRDHASPSGYAFRATAKRTQTGILLGSVTKTGRDYRYEKSREVVATGSGYELRPGSSALVLQNVSQELAIDLMNSMAGSWPDRPR